MSQRHRFLDVLRGLAVVLMIYTHALGSWLLPEAQHGAWFAVSSFLFALPSRLFLFLLGFALALRLDGAGGLGGALRACLWRAGQLLLLGLALRAHEWAGHGFSEPARLFKVDILNCMAMATLVMAACLRRGGRASAGRAVGLGVLLVAIAPALAGWSPPPWLPAQVAAYVAGPRPMAWFPMVPWAAYALFGLAAGVLWQARRPAAPTSAGLAVVLIGAALGARALLPAATARTAAAEAEPALFALFLGVMLLLCVATERACAGRTPRWSPLDTLGRASLPVYFVHLAIVYGHVSEPWWGRLGARAALLGFVAVTGAMIVVAALWARRPRFRAARPSDR